MSVFGEATTLKIVLPCRRRAYFSKTGRRGNCQEKDPKTAPKVQLKWVPGGSLGAPWADLSSFDRVLEGACFSPRHFGVSGASGPDGDHRGLNQTGPQVLSICLFI